MAMFLTGSINLLMKFSFLSMVPSAGVTAAFIGPGALTTYTFSGVHLPEPVLFPS